MMLYIDHSELSYAHAMARKQSKFLKFLVITLDIFRVTFKANGRIKLRISLNRKWADKNMQSKTILMDENEKKLLIFCRSIEQVKTSTGKTCNTMTSY